MKPYHGKFVWYELMTTDTAAAERFYREVVGWSAKDAGVPGMPYTLVSAGDTRVAGLMTMPKELSDAGARPCWLTYIGVDDVDAWVDKVKQAGGSLHRPPQDIPGVGRFAVVADPDGAVFQMMSHMPDGPDPKITPGMPGHVGWNELLAGDRERVFAFYEKLFGWRRLDSMDMGPMGVYQMFGTGGDAVGGMMTRSPEVPMPCWVFYFNVAHIDAALERVKANGGTVVFGPVQVPGGGFAAQGLDPQGALFALFGPR